MEPVTLKQFSEKALAATVLLETVDSDGPPVGCGCGFLVAPNQIVTSFHVIEGAAKGTAKLVGKSTTRPLYERNGLVSLPYSLPFDIEGITASDEKNNLVILAVTAFGSQPLPLGDSDSVRIGESVYVVDNPKNREGTLSSGIISGITEDESEKRIRVKSAISPRGSGAAVLNKEGKVIGISCMMLEDGHPLNFAVPSNYLKALLTQLEPAKPLSQGKQAASAETYFRRGDTNYATGQHQEAIAAYDTAIRLRPDFANAYVNRGLAKEKLGQHEAAIIDYSRAIELNPSLASPYNNRGNAKSKLEQYFAAIADLDTAIQLKPDYAIAYVNRCSAKSRLGHPTAAIEDFDTAIEFDPDHAEAYRNQGVTKASQMQPADAIEDFTAAIRRDAKCPNAYYSRGVAHFTMGQIQEAKSDLQTALELAENIGDVPLISSTKSALTLIEEKQTDTSYSSSPTEAPHTVEGTIQAIEEKSTGGDYIFRGESECYEKVASNLYRELKAIGSKESDIANIQGEIVDAAKAYSDKTEDFEILTELQHYGGKTNLIDFTSDYHVALFFACYGSPGADGRVILLQKTEAIKEIVKSPPDQEHRVSAQKSVFVQPPKGFIERKKYEIVRVPSSLKLSILQRLQANPGINPRTIYHDIHGFIKSDNAYWRAYREFYKGITARDEGAKAEMPEEKRAAYEKSVTHYTTALELALQHPDIYNNRGGVYSDIAELNLPADDYLKLAIDDYAQAIRLDPQGASAYCNRGNAYRLKKAFDEAISDYDKAVQLNPNFAEAYINRGSAYAAKGEPDKAITDYTQAIERKADFAEAYSNRGNAHFTKGNLGSAIDDCNKAIQLDPDQAEAYYTRGVAYFFTPRERRVYLPESDGVEANRLWVDKAIDDFNTAIELNSGFPMVYCMRGAAQLHTKEWDKAKTDLKVAGELELDVVAMFHEVYRSIENCERIIGTQLPEDIKAMLAPQ